MPCALDLLCLVKKLTVIGIIGNTQGVSKAAKPLKNEIMKMSQKDLGSSFDSLLCSVIEASTPRSLVSVSSALSASFVSSASAL